MDLPNGTRTLERVELFVELAREPQSLLEPVAAKVAGDDGAEGAARGAH
jgi:hypothetical protein